jgi:hypothetical protein
MKTSSLPPKGSITTSICIRNFRLFPVHAGGVVRLSRLKGTGLR